MNHLWNTARKLIQRGHEVEYCENKEIKDNKSEIKSLLDQSCGRFEILL